MSTLPRADASDEGVVTLNPVSGTSDHADEVRDRSADAATPSARRPETGRSGNAIAVLIGNGRRFPPGGSTQANVEDGRFDVALVHDTDSIDLATVGNATGGSIFVALVKDTHVVRSGPPPDPVEIE